MYRVVAAKLSAAVEWKTATMTMVSQSQNNRQENVLSDSDCHHCPKRHTGQRVGVQPATEDAQCPEEKDVAVFDEQASGPTIGNLPTLTEEFHQRLVRPRQEGTFGNQETRSGTTEVHTYEFKSVLHGGESAMHRQKQQLFSAHYAITALACLQLRNTGTVNFSLTVYHFLVATRRSIRPHL